MLKVIGVGVVFFVGLVGLVFKDEIGQLNILSFSNDGDQRLNYLFMQWTWDYFFGEVPPSTLNIFDFVIFYPYRESLALSVNHFGSLPVTYVLNLFTDDWFVRGNYWLLTCCFLNGFSAYIFAYKFLGHYKGAPKDGLPKTFIALFIGVSFGFSMVRIHYIEHSQTIPTYIVPVFFYVGWRLMQSPSWARAILLALLFSWQMYLDLHIGIFLIFFSVVLVLQKCAVLLWQRDLTYLKEQLLPKGLIFALFVGFLCWPLLSPYLMTVEIFGDRGLSVHGPAERNYLRPSVAFGIYRDIFDKFTYNEGAVLPSLVFVPMVLFVVLLFLGKSFRLVVSAIRGSKRSITNTLFYIMTCIPILLLVDIIAHRSPVAHFFRAVIPGLKSLRTPGRFSIFSMFIMAITLLVLAFRARLFQRYPKISYTFVLLVTAFMVTEVSTVNFLHWKKKDLAEYSEVTAIIDGPAIFLPVERSNYDTVDLMQLAIEHRFKIGNGYSGFEIPALRNLRGYETSIPIDDLLQRLKVTYEFIVFDKKKWSAKSKLNSAKNTSGLTVVLDTAKFLVLKTDQVDFSVWQQDERWKQVDKYLEPNYLGTIFANYDGDCIICSADEKSNSGLSRQ